MGRRPIDRRTHARTHERLLAVNPANEPSDALSVAERVNAALDKVRPAIAADGGEVWLVKVEKGIAYVQMLGACGGCPASTMTLKGAIETVVCADVPEVSEVVQI
jgi:Fe-S cluster biogenesis protein NfuA